MNGNYKIPVLKVQEYDLKSIYEKKLYFLLPFYIFRFEKTFADMGKTIEPKAALPLLFFGEFKQPSRRKKGGRYNVCYISRFNSDRYTHCCPCKFDLSDSQGKKEIAATTHNSDGGPLRA